KALDDELKIKQAAIGELEVRIEQCVAEQRAADARIEKHLVDNTEFNDQLSEIQGRYYGLGSDIARLEQSIEHHIERVAQLRRDLNETQEGWSTTQRDIESDVSKINALQTELEIISPKLEEAQALEESSSYALEEAEERMQRW